MNSQELIQLEIPRRRYLYWKCLFRPCLPNLWRLLLRC